MIFGGVRESKVKVFRIYHFFTNLNWKETFAFFTKLGLIKFPFLGTDISTNTLDYADVCEGHQSKGPIAHFEKNSATNSTISNLKVPREISSTCLIFEKIFWSKRGKGLLRSIKLQHIKCIFVKVYHLYYIQISWIHLGDQNLAFRFLYNNSHELVDAWCRKSSRQIWIIFCISKYILIRIRK